MAARLSTILAVSSHMQEFKSVVHTDTHRNSKKVWQNTHAIPADKHCKACHMFTMLVSNCQRSQTENKAKCIEAMRKKEGAGRRHAEKKWGKIAGRGRVQKWTLCRQVLLFSGKSGTLLRQYAIGMRKVSGFALFATKSDRVCSFSKNGTEDSKKQKAGLIPEYPNVSRDTFDCNL